MLCLPGLGLCIKAGKLAVVEFSVAVFVETLEQMENLVWREQEWLLTQDWRRTLSGGNKIGTSRRTGREPCLAGTRMAPHVGQAENLVWREQEWHLT